MSNYSWSGGTSGDWDDPQNWFDNSETDPEKQHPSGPPGGGDNADLGDASSVTIDGDSVSNVSGEGPQTELIGNFTVTGTLGFVTVEGGSVSIGTAQDCSFASGNIQVSEFENSSEITGADVTTGNIDTSGDFDGLEIESGSLTAGSLDFEESGSFVGIQMHGGTLNATTLTLGALQPGTNGLALAGDFEVDGGANATISGQTTDNFAIFLIGSSTGHGGTVNFEGGLTLPGQTPLLIRDGGAGKVTGTTLLSGLGQILVSNAGSLFQTTNLTLSGPQTLLSVTDGASAAIGSKATLENATLSVGSGSSLTVGSGVSAAADQLHVGSTGSIVGTGFIASTATGTIDGGGKSKVSKYSLTVDNDGTIEADGSLKPAGFSLVVEGNVTGDGSLKIAQDSTLEVIGSVAKGQTVEFDSDGSGQLVLDDPKDFQGTIKGLSDGDEIVLKNITPSGGGLAVVGATLGYLTPDIDQQLYLQIQTADGPPYGIGSVLTNAPIDIPGFNNSDYFTVSSPNGTNSTVLTYHQGSSADPKDNPLDLAVNGKAVTQTGAGVTIGVISFGPELQAMEDVAKDIAPNAHVIGATGGGGATVGAINTLVAAGAQIIVDDTFGNFLDGTANLGINEAIETAFRDNGVTFVTAAGNSMSPPFSIYYGTHQTLPEEITVAAMNMLATPGLGAYLPAGTEAYSDTPAPFVSGKPNVTGPDYGPTNLPSPFPPPLDQIELLPLGGLNPFAGTSAAAPAIAAVAALMLQANDQLTNYQIQQILENPANATGGIGGPAPAGAGLVNAQKAVAAAVALRQSIVPPPSDSPRFAAASAAPAPAVTLAYLSTPPGGDVEAGSTVKLTVELSEGVVVTGVPALTLNNGGLASLDANASDPAAGRLVFDYTTGVGEQTPDLKVTGLGINGATIKDSNGNDANFSALLNVPTGVTIDSPLQVTSVTASQSGEARSGRIIDLTIKMSEGVVLNIAGGPPTLLLNDGATATYDAKLSNPSAGTLVFAYKIGSTDKTPDLAIAAVVLPHGTTLQDAAGNNADLAVGTIDRELGLQIGSAFVIGLGTSQTGSAQTGETVEIDLVTSEPVSVHAVRGGPTLTLADGGIATYDAAASVPSTGTLAFDYTVGSHDTPNLEILKFNANGTTFKDQNGVNAVLPSVLDVPTGLTINSPLTVKSVASSQTGQSAQVTLTMSEGATVNLLGGSPTLSLSDHTTATYDAANSSPQIGILAFDDTLAVGERVSSLHITGVDLNGAQIADAGGNNADFSAALGEGPGSPLFVSNASHVETAGNLKAGGTVTFMLTMSEQPLSVKGVPGLTLNDGGVATYVASLSKPAAGTLVFRYTVAPGQNAADLGVTGLTNGPWSVTDAAGHPADFVKAVQELQDLGLAVDTQKPTISAASPIPASGGVLKLGSTAEIDLDVSEAVVVSGTPRLRLNDGGTAIYNPAASTPASGILEFDYVVSGGQSTTDLKIAAVSLPAGASIKDTAGNAAKLTLTAKEANLGLKVDGIMPKVTAVTESPASGNIVTGGTVSIKLKATETLTVTGQPTLALNDGGSAIFSGGAGTNTLTFLYTAGAGQSTPDLKITGIEQPAGNTITDLAGNPLSSTLATNLHLKVNQPPAAHAAAHGASGSVALADVGLLANYMAASFVTGGSEAGTPIAALPAANQPVIAHAHAG